MSDKTDRTTEPKHDFGPEYEHIPRDAAGDPVFLILPDGVREYYESKMAACEAGWRETKDPLFVDEAIVWMTNYRQVPPLWFDKAVHDVCVEHRTPEHARRAREAAAHFERFGAVVHAKRREGLTWDAAYARAAELVADAVEETCRNSYQRVNRHVKQGLAGLYIPPRVRNQNR
jgi:hypothetical protein